MVDYKLSEKWRNDIRYDTIGEFNVDWKLSVISLIYTRNQKPKNVKKRN